MGHFRDTKDDLREARRIRCDRVCDLRENPVDLRVIRINHDAREKTVVAEPVREERQILNVKLAMDGQDALIGCVFRENHQ